MSITFTIVQACNNWLIIKSLSRLDHSNYNYELITEKHRFTV